MRVPDSRDVFNGDNRSIIAKSIQLTLDQAKARGTLAMAAEHLKVFHKQLTEAHREFKETLLQPAGPKTTARIELLFELTVLQGYWLGSASPDPQFVIKQKDRTAKANKARAQGWEEPVEKAIRKIVQDDPYADYKTIIRQVRDEMKRRRVKIPEDDAFLRKRIRPHRNLMQEDYEAQQRWERGQQRLGRRNIVPKS